MGYLTTLTIYNDGMHLIKGREVEFCEKMFSVSHDGGTFGLSGFCNLVEVQKSRHADDITVFVHSGNCVTEVNPYNKDFKRLMVERPEIADSYISELETQLKMLKQARKNQRNHN